MSLPSWSDRSTIWAGARSTSDIASTRYRPIDHGFSRFCIHVFGFLFQLMYTRNLLKQRFLCVPLDLHFTFFLSVFCFVLFWLFSLLPLFASSNLSIPDKINSLLRIKMINSTNESYALLKPKLTQWFTSIQVDLCVCSIVFSFCFRPDQKSLIVYR